VKKVMICWIKKNGTLEGSEHANSRRLLGFFFFLTYLQHWRVVPKWWWHTRGFSGLLTPRNEVGHATTAEALQKTLARFKKKSKEKKRIFGLGKEFDRRRKKKLQILLPKRSLVYRHLEIKLILQPFPAEWRPTQRGHKK